MELYCGDLQVGHPTFAAGWYTREISAPKLVCSKEDDDAIDEFHTRSGSYTT